MYLMLWVNRIHEKSYRSVTYVQHMGHENAVVFPYERNAIFMLHMTACIKDAVQHQHSGVSQYGCVTHVVL